MSPHAVDWGNVPEWVSAFTTLGALAAAGWVVAIELRRDTRAVRAREAAEQADLVAAWLIEDEETGDYWLHLRNGSPLPVYQVGVTLMPDPEGRPQHMDTIRVVPPGEHQLLWIPQRLAASSDELGDVPEFDPHLMTWAPVVSFGDAASRRWTRGKQGRLVRNVG